MNIFNRGQRLFDRRTNRYFFYDHGHHGSFNHDDFEDRGHNGNNPILDAVEFAALYSTFSSNDSAAVDTDNAQVDNTANDFSGDGGQFGGAGASGDFTPDADNSSDSFDTDSSDSSSDTFDDDSGSDN